MRCHNNYTNNSITVKLSKLIDYNQIYSHTEMLTRYEELIVTDAKYTM